MMFNYSVSGVILAGGNSSRMESDKKELIYNGKSFLDIAINTLEQSKCDNVYINLANSSYNKNNIILDKIKNIGPLSGVLASLQQIKSDFIIFIPVDMPLLTPEIILNLVNQIKNNNAIYYKNYVFPFVIKNSTKIISIIQNQILENRYSIKSFLSNIDAKEIDFKYDIKYLQNINYKEEYLGLN